MSAWNEGDSVVDGVRIHYTRTGGNKPPVVLVHGYTDAGLCWTPTAQALEADYDLVMVDARGHGRSDAPETGYNLAEMAHDIQGVITSLGLHRPAVIGHSMGGGITLAMAGLYPNIPGAIILEDAGPLYAGDFPHRTAANPAPGQTLLERRKNKTRDDLINEVRAERHWPEGELGPWADAKLAFHPHAAAFDPITGIDWNGIMPRITCPALLITADLERGAMVRPERIAELQQQVPQFQVAHIAGAGHNVRREQFDAYMHVVRAFLADWAATYGHLIVSHHD